MIQLQAPRTFTATAATSRRIARTRAGWRRPRLFTGRSISPAWPTGPRQPRQILGQRQTPSTTLQRSPGCRLPRVALARKGQDKAVCPNNGGLLRRILGKSLRLVRRAVLAQRHPRANLARPSHRLRSRRAARQCPTGLVLPHGRDQPGRRRSRTTQGRRLSGRNRQRGYSAFWTWPSVWTRGARGMCSAALNGRLLSPATPRLAPYTAPSSAGTAGNFTNVIGNGDIHTTG